MVLTCLFIDMGPFHPCFFLVDAYLFSVILVKIYPTSSQGESVEFLHRVLGQSICHAEVNTK